MTHKQLLRMNTRPMVTNLFSRTLARLGIPPECWGAVAYYYWTTDGSIPRVDRERLMDDIRSGAAHEAPGLLTAARRVDDGVVEGTGGRKMNASHQLDSSSGFPTRT